MNERKAGFWTILGYWGFTTQYCILIWLGGEFWVFNFREAFVADFGEPALEGFGFGGWDGLDDSE